MRLKRSGALRVALETLAPRDAAQARRGHATRGDLLHVFGDRVLVDRVAAAASLPPLVVADVLERTRVQFSATTERAWSHVTDRSRLVAVDRRALDEGTATAHATTIDVEDYAVLFELDRMRAARRGTPPIAPRAFDMIAIDEAQELAPLELALVGRSLAPGGTLVVAGDADQHTDETATFVGWDAAMRELGAQDHATTTLDIGHRCPPDVVAVARAVRDGGRAAAPVTTTEGATTEGEASLAEAIGRAAAATLRRDRRASIAVICRNPRTARRFAALLRAAVPTRLVFDGRFLPRGPVQVTIASEVKGLEFDYVVVPDATAAEWPDDAASRRALYVAVTRARHQILFACAGAPTPLVAPLAPLEPRG
jgi:DNA helicase IV